jgi:RNA polymerase sigma-70 factor (ECF subfamily)
MSSSCRTSWREVIEANDQDEDLLRRSAKGDQQAFSLLYSRHQPSIYRFVVRMSGSTWAADEILQDVFMILLREPKKFDATRGSLAAYLYGIARNRVMKHFERLPRELQMPEHGENGVVTLPHVVDHRTPAHWAELHERRDQVHAAVLGLPAEFREAVVLCELEEMSYEQAAHVLQCPVGTIRSRLHRGRALLLAKLELLRGNPKRASASR